MYGASAAPMISSYARFSSTITMTFTYAGRCGCACAGAAAMTVTTAMAAAIRLRATVQGMRVLLVVRRCATAAKHHRRHSARISPRTRAVRRVAGLPGGQELRRGDAEGGGPFPA